MRVVTFSLAVGVVLLTGCNQPAQQIPQRPVEAGNGVSGRVVLPAGSPHLNQLKVAPVMTIEALLDEVVAPGKVEINPNRVSRVFLPLPGRIREVSVRLGDAVKEGQVLLSLDSPETDATTATCLQAEASILQARAALLKFRADSERIRDLYEAGAIAKKEVVNVETDLAHAEASLKEAEASREQIKRRMALLGLKGCEFGQHVGVRSPGTGKILEINIAPGEYHSETASPVMVIADLSTVWIASEVPESSIRFIQVGERIEIELAAYPGEVFRGRVMRIADVVDPQTRMVKVQTELDNRAGRFRPEMFARIRHSHGTAPVNAVPASAVLQGGGGPVVFLEKSPGEFQRVPVMTGEQQKGMVPILSGLNAGDRVVVDGAVLLKAF